MKDSIRWALRSGRHVAPVCVVTWKSRGQTIQTSRFAESGHDWPETFADPIVNIGGFGGIREGPSVLPGTLEPVKTVVSISDLDRTWASFLETYMPKYSEAAIYLACPDLLEDDWEPLFVGLVDGWELRGPNVDLKLLGSDDRSLFAECPKATFDRTTWGYAPDPTIFGQFIPYVWGYQDAFQVTGGGMVPATPVMWDEVKGYRWLASGGSLKSVSRVFYDGVLQTFTHTVERGVYGNVAATLISVPIGSQPADWNAIVAFDGEGPDATGGISGAVLANPVEQLRIALINYVFGDLRHGSYAATHPRIHAASWDAVSTYLDVWEYESGRIIGGDRERQSGLALVETFLQGHTQVRMWWTALGQIAMCVVPIADADAPSSTDLARLDPARVSHAAAAADLFTDVTTSFMWSSAEQAYLSSYVAQDVGLREVLGLANILLVENPWSQARFTKE